MLEDNVYLLYILAALLHTPLGLRRVVRWQLSALVSLHSDCQQGNMYTCLASRVRATPASLTHGPPSRQGGWSQVGFLVINEQQEHVIMKFPGRTPPTLCKWRVLFFSSCQFLYLQSHLVRFGNVIIFIGNLFHRLYFKLS